MSSPSDFKNNLKEMLMYYLASRHDNKRKDYFMNEELEVRFKPNKQKFFSKTDYDNVISRLMGCGFYCENSNGTNMLRIQTEYRNENGKMYMSNIRTELCGSEIIQQYCKLNDDLNKISKIQENERKIKFTQKSTAKHGEKTIDKITNDDFGFNVSFNLETDYFLKSEKAKQILSTWNESKKTFRLINRIRYKSRDSPIAVDLSILRTSSTSKHVMIPANTIHESGIFDNQETYEIELEIVNDMVGLGTKYTNIDVLVGELQRIIKIVLSGLQNSKYPISYKEQENVLTSYMTLIHGKEYIPRRIITKDFIGPNSRTLQLNNIIESSNSSEANIRKNYCVTDKADGERKLLFINHEGRIYLIDTNMQIQFTGSITDRKEFADTIIDGEHIKYDKTGAYVNMFAAFDIYFLKGENVRSFNFMVENTDKLTEKRVYEYRFPLMKLSIQKMNTTLKSFMKDMPNDIQINTKIFHFPSASMDIFQKCHELFASIEDDTYQYETDGVIFTPINTGVGGMRSGMAGKMEKTTWPLSLKWKPPHFNTIDFLVTYKKDSAGKEIIHNKFENGINLSTSSVQRYRTLVLMCGFDKKTDIIINPFQNVLDDVIPSKEKTENEASYIPVPFQPSLPYDPNTCYANMYIEESDNGFLKTLEGEMFEKNMIVEFSYDMNKEPGWRWVPLRVRHDKTYDYRMNNKNFGNAYHVANDNWKSIHFPVTKEMLSGIDIPSEDNSDEVYYNKRHDDNNYTEGLRNFHNLYVKKRLLTGVSKPEDTLIDYAVGKGGDISKWKQSRLKFVFGIDVAPDNIYNQKDGVCARYLSERSSTRNLFSGIFLQGNSGLNIKDGSAFVNSKDKAIANAIVGNSKMNSELGKAVSQNHGIGSGGFNVSSCQFAIHYFFENKTTLHNFLRNVSENTKLNGYFVGTCYDGQTVFNKLKDNGDYSIYVDDKMIFNIQKKYNETGFVDDERSLGYAINVFQESINKYSVEYLVNFEYLRRLMEDYGFILIESEEANALGFKSGSGLFGEMFKQMIDERNNHLYREAPHMSNREKEISFLNRYFIFRKNSSVDSKKISRIIKVENAADEDEIKDKEGFEKEVRKALDQPIMFVKKLKKKIVLNKYEPVSDEPKAAEPKDMPKDEPKKEEEEPKDEEEKKEKKKRCEDGTRRFPAIGKECYTHAQIDEYKKNKTKKAK